MRGTLGPLTTVECSAFLLRKVDFQYPVAAEHAFAATRASVVLQGAAHHQQVSCLALLDLVVDHVQENDGKCSASGRCGTSGTTC
jgi:hypothetical protein